MSRRNKRFTNRPAPASPGMPVQFNPDYSHVKRDLKRIGALAGTFFILLIVLSFFIR
jgi:hypothetical protein